MTIPIQLALQGGGAKITYLIAALEAVQALEREGVIRVTRIAGTSAGAIAGALYAAGVDMKRVRDTFEAHRDELLRAFPPATTSLRAAWCLLTRRPYWNAEPLRRVLATLLAPHERLGDLDIPLTIVTSDLTNMQPCVYQDPVEPLLSSLLDSAGIPFFFRTAPAGSAAYRVIADGGVCENLPCDQLSYNAELGEVVGISFGASRSGAPVTGSLGFTRALFETALNASELRAHLVLGMNNLVVRTDAGTFDIGRAFHEGLGAEYRETRLLADDFFRRYAARAAEPAEEGRPRPNGDEAVVRRRDLPVTRLQDLVASLRNWYREQERDRFDFLAVRMIVTGGGKGPGAVDDVRHEVVFRATEAPIHCYKIRLTSAWSLLNRTDCELFDRYNDPVAFDVAPITDDPGQPCEVLLLFHRPIVPGDERAPLTLRVRDTVPGALRLARNGQAELLVTRATRADRPIGRIEIVVHLPEELSNAVIAPAPGSGGKQMTPAELVHHAPPAGFITLGWKGEQIPPDTAFGCNLIRTTKEKKRRKS